MKKRIIPLLLALAMSASAASLFACNNKTGKETEIPFVTKENETEKPTEQTETGSQSFVNINPPETQSPDEQTETNEILKKITSEEAKKILLQHEAENAYYIDIINWHEKDNIATKYMSGYGALILLSSFGFELSTDIIPVDNAFDTAGLCDWLTATKSNSSVSIDVQRLTEEQRAEITETLTASHSFRNTTKQYLFTAQVPLSSDEHIRSLTAEDKDAFITMEFIQSPNRPPQEILFNEFILKASEETGILAYFEDGIILGYLSYYKVTGDYFEKEYLWTAPSRKNEGIEDKLIDAYAEKVMEKGGKPMWSTTDMETSNPLLESHGFTAITEIMSFNEK